LVQGNLASQFKKCNPSDYFMWCEIEREVNRYPHNTLASLRSKIKEVMADMDREVIIPPLQEVLV
jgi:hypothetical protein